MVCCKAHDCSLQGFGTEDPGGGIRQDKRRTDIFREYDQGFRIPVLCFLPELLHHRPDFCFEGCFASVMFR
jgi:hypothetical protein